MNKNSKYIYIKYIYSKRIEKENKRLKKLKEKCDIYIKTLPQGILEVNNKDIVNRNYYQ